MFVTPLNPCMLDNKSGFITTMQNDKFTEEEMHNYRMAVTEREVLIQFLSPLSHSGPKRLHLDAGRLCEGPCDHLHEIPQVTCHSLLRTYFSYSKEHQLAKPEASVGLHRHHGPPCGPG